MNLGTAWVIVETSNHTGESSLLSIISFRRSKDYICTYMEQMYVDKYASIEEKIEYKKNRKKSPFAMERHAQRGSPVCGHEPTYIAYQCSNMKLEGNTLKFKYRVHEGGVDNHSSKICEGSAIVA
jgi:hypothetical protein